jgi:hypothetical protein
MLRAIVIGLSLVVFGAGYIWPQQFPLLRSLVLLWLVAYGVPFIVASLRFRRIIQASAAEVVERRHARRATGIEQEGQEGRPIAKPAIDPKAGDEEVRSTE